MKKNLNLITLSITLTLLITACGSKIKDPNVLVKKAVDVALNDGDWSESLSYAKKAVKLDSQNVDALVIYALALERNGKTKDVLKTLRKAIDIMPENFIAQLTLGRILYTKEDYEGAYEHLANAYKIQPDDVDVLILFSQCSAKLQAQNTDKLLFKLANTKYYKNKPEIYNELGTYYTETQNLSKAAQNLSKAYKLAPDNPIIVSNLGIFCDRYLKSPQKALFFYRKFISLTENNQGFISLRDQIITRLKEIK